VATTTGRHDTGFLTFLEVRQMTMQLVSDRGEELFSTWAWKVLIDLARRYGWQPAGAREPFSKDSVQSGGDFVELSEEQLEAYEIPAGHPVAGAVKSLFVESGDLVLDSYFRNAGFRVTAGDARALADALERALPDIPDHDGLGHKAVTLPTSPGENFLPLDTPASPYEVFSGQNKARLRRFIGFCRRGGFAIR
jgi:hypothetical protein